MKDLSVEEKQTIGKYSNDMKKRLNELFADTRQALMDAEVERQIAAEYEDMTWSTDEVVHTRIHPIHQTQKDVADAFVSMGFSVFESQQVATEYCNFDALNIPASHPARDMQDTFWLEGVQKVLSTQNTSLDNHLLKTQDVPFQAIVLGHVFRNEEVDATHDIMFDQVDGICVGTDISMGHLKYTLKTMLFSLFNREVEIRMRPGYFPFVEPGVEIDFSCPFCQDDTCRVCGGS